MEFHLPLRTLETKRSMASKNAPRCRFGVVAPLLISMALSLPTMGRHYGRVLLMGKWNLIFDDQRIIFNAGMIAGDFFDQLERRETENGLLFLIHSGRRTRPVTNYPESLVVKVFANPWDSRDTPFDKRCAGTAAALMGSLQFQAEWKTGLKTRPVSKMTMRHLERNEISPTTLWAYELKISSEGVPLTDHLIVNVYDPNSNLVVRFSGAP
ncbi:MAG: hypothetical protein QOG55_2213 [Acidobacteriaceae bacterium]|jgi:hypothetical protein|nr:hypothetical protein [Acidobacteriaceae bacterium]